MDAARDDQPTPETVTNRRTRRALLTGAMAAVGATVLKAVTAPFPVRAAGDDGQAVVVGGFYDDVQSQLTLANQANNEIVLWAASNDAIGNGGGIGVAGYSAKNVGVYAESKSGFGVKAVSASFHAIQGTSNRESGGYGVLGYSNSTSSGAGVSGQSQWSRGVAGTSTFDTGVYGYSTNNNGIYGQASSTGYAGVVGNGPVGVKGISSGATKPAVAGVSQADSTGVFGFSGPYAASEPATKAKTGVLGVANQDAGSRGVWGKSSKGHGVHGEASSGSAVYGTSSSGYALRGNGRVRFEKVSGVASIPAGATKVTVSPGVNVTTSSFVLLTPKANLGTRGLWFTTDASRNTFTIRMGSSRSSSTKVAWLLLG